MQFNGMHSSLPIRRYTLYCTVTALYCTILCCTEMHHFIFQGCRTACTPGQIMAWVRRGGGPHTRPSQHASSMSVLESRKCTAVWIRGIGGGGHGSVPRDGAAYTHPSPTHELRSDARFSGTPRPYPPTDSIAAQADPTQSIARRLRRKTAPRRTATAASG